MTRDFISEVWELGRDNPDFIEIVARAITKTSKETGYSIPVREYCNATGEIEDIHLNYLNIEDEKKREKIEKIIKRVDQLTIGELAKELSTLSLLYRIKGTSEELEPYEKTLKDIDITRLALFTLLAPIRHRDLTDPEEED